MEWVVMCLPLSQLPGEHCLFSNRYLGRRHFNTERIGVSLSTPASLFNVTAAVLFLATSLSCSLQTQSVLCGGIALDKVNGRYGCILCKWTSGNEAMKEQKYSGCQQMAYHSICFQHRILTEVSREKTVSLLARYLFTITCIKKEGSERIPGQGGEREHFKRGAVLPVLCGQSRGNHGRSAFQRGQVSTSILATQQTSAVIFILV